MREYLQVLFVTRWTMLQFQQYCKAAVIFIPCSLHQLCHSLHHVGPRKKGRKSQFQESHIMKSTDERTVKNRGELLPRSVQAPRRCLEDNSTAAIWWDREATTWHLATAAPRRTCLRCWLQPWLHCCQCCATNCCMPRRNGDEVYKVRKRRDFFQQVME